MIYRSNEKKNEKSATIKSSLMTYFYSYECFRFRTFLKSSIWFINIFIFNVVSFEVTSATIKFASFVKIAILSTLRTMIVNRFLNDKEKTCCVTTCNWNFDNWCDWMKLKLISRIIATRRFRFFLIFCFNCINLWIMICFSNKNFSTNLATLFWNVLLINKLFEMFFVVLLMKIRIFSFVIVFFFLHFDQIISFFIFLKFINCLFDDNSIISSRFYNKSFYWIIQFISLLIQHASSIYSLFYARLFSRRSLTRSIFKLTKYWKKTFFDWILIFSRRNLLLREARSKKTLNRSSARRSKNLSSIFKSSIFLFFSIFAILFVDVFFSFASTWTRLWELSESC
jgi:hypothetical protein